MDQLMKENIEDKLRNYPVLKSKIKIKVNQIAYQEEYTAKAVNYNKIPGGKTNDIYSDIENFVQKKLDNYPELLDMILQKNRIDSALECLNYREHRLVRYKYFEGMTDQEISEKMRQLEKQTFQKHDIDCRDYSTATIQRMKVEVLDKLQKVGLGEK